MARVEGIYDEAMSLLERLVSTVKETEDMEENESNFDENTINQLSDCMEYFASAKLQREASDKIFALAMEKIEKVDVAEEAADIVKNYESELKKVGKISGVSDSRYTEFVESLRQEDEDIRTVKSTPSLIDPISKQQMVNPVKNRACGHTYEKSVVLELIAKNPKTRCPMMGCAAPVIKKSDLVPDVDLKRYLEHLAKHSNSTILEDSNIIALDQTDL